MKILGWKSTINEIKYSLDGPNSRMEMTEERVCELEDRSREVMHVRTESKLIRGRRNRRKKRELWS